MARRRNPRTNARLVPITFRLEPEILTALREASDREDIAQSVIVEEGITLALKQPLSHLPKRGSRFSSRPRRPSEQVLGRSEEQMIEWRTRDLAKKLPMALARKVAAEEFQK